MFLSLCDFIRFSNSVNSFHDRNICFLLDFTDALSLEVDAQRDQTQTHFRISHRVQNVQGSPSQSPKSAARMSRSPSLREVMTPEVCNMTNSPCSDGCCEARCGVW